MTAKNIKWLGVQTWKPPSPPPPWNVIGYEFGNETFWPHHLSTWPRGQAITKTFHVFNLDSSVTVLRRNFVFGFVWIALTLGFVNKCSRKTRMITIIHHLSSPPAIIFKESHHFVTPWVKVSCFAFVKFCNGFARIFLSFDFTIRNSVWKSAGVVFVNMLVLSRELRIKLRNIESSFEILSWNG